METSLAAVALLTGRGVLAVCHPLNAYGRVVVARFEHPSRVARWRNGAFELLPEASTATQTVWFPFLLDDEHGS